MITKLDDFDVRFFGAELLKILPEETKKAVALQLFMAISKEIDLKAIAELVRAAVFDDMAKEAGTVWREKIKLLDEATEKSFTELSAIVFHEAESLKKKFQKRLSECDAKLEQDITNRCNSLLNDSAKKLTSIAKQAFDDERVAITRQLKQKMGEVCSALFNEAKGIMSKQADNAVDGEIASLMASIKKHGGSLRKNARHVKTVAKAKAAAKKKPIAKLATRKRG